MKDDTKREWIFDDADEYGYSYKCSNCGYTIMARVKNATPNACPKCKVNIQEEIVNA